MIRTRLPDHDFHNILHVPTGAPSVSYAECFTCSNGVLLIRLVVLAIITYIDCYMGKNSGTPYFSKVGILHLLPYRWATPAMACHQIIPRLTTYFNVVWVTPAQGWRELWLRKRSTPEMMFSQRPEGTSFEIYEPGRFLPQLYRPRWLASLTARARLRQARRILTDKGCDKIILYLWRPAYEFSLQMIEYSLSCYHIDDEYTFATVEEPVHEQEARVINCVDQVFIHSPALWEKKAHLNPHSALVPNGVDYYAFASPAEEPPDMRQIPHPRVGYVGVIKVQLDLSLLFALAQRHREWSFVLVGPRGFLGEQASVIENLSKLPNVHFLGGKPIDALPAYVQHLDVCMLCYALSDYTKFIYPLKLHEYLASGRPIVASPIRTLQEFGRVIRLASDLDEWSTALAASLGPEANHQSEISARRRLALEHDWDNLAHRVARVLCERLGSDWAQRFDELTGASTRQ